VIVGRRPSLCLTLATLMLRYSTISLLALLLLGCRPIESLDPSMDYGYALDDEDCAYSDSLAAQIPRTI